MSQHAEDPTPVSPRARWIVGAVAVGLLVLWGALFQPFTLPNNDYYSYERAALRFAELEAPSSWKRGPILPFLMAATAPVLGGEHPELRAALLWNLLFSIGIVLLVFDFTRRTLGAGAGLVAALLISAPQLHAMALQPLAEPGLGFFVAAAFCGLARRSPWQYAAAGAAALVRPEAAALLAVLFAVNVNAERRLLRHAGLALLGALPFLVWNLLGARLGTGATDYLEIMRGVGPRSAAFLLVHYAKDLFHGWYTREPGLGWLALLAAVGVPGLIGLRRAWRAAPRETIALVAYFVLQLAAVIAFGVSKGRYIHSTQWIPLYFFGAGVLGLARFGVRRPAAGAALRNGALGLLAAALAVVVVELARAHDAEFALPFLLLLGGILALAGIALREAVPPRPNTVAILALLLALLLPVFGGNLLRTTELLGQVRRFDAGAVPAAAWLSEELRSGEKAAIQHVAQVLFLTDLDPEQVLAFGTFEARDAAELREEMRVRRVSYAVYTFRAPAESRAAAFYDERKRRDLAELFAGGGPVEGFEHVATLDGDAAAGIAPPQVYRVLPRAAPGAGGAGPARRAPPGARQTGPSGTTR